MNGRLILVAAVIMLSGCANTKVAPLDNQQMAGLQGRTIALSHRNKPTFTATTAGTVALGVLGVYSAKPDGNKLVADNAIEDPAVYIGQKLTEDLALMNLLTVVDAGDVVANSSDIRKLAKQYAKADLLLDVQTTDWNFIYFPTDWDNYQVIYRAKLRLIDTKQAKLLAEGYCEREPGKTSDAPSYNELVGNRALGLKHWLAKHRDSCLEEFRRTALQGT